MEIKVMHQIMEWNEDVSDQVKATLSDHKICMINVMGSPGAGKTSMIVALIAALRETYRIGVIEGDIAGQLDAETIDKLGIPVDQREFHCKGEFKGMHKGKPDENDLAEAARFAKSLIG